MAHFYTFVKAESISITSTTTDSAISEEHTSRNTSTTTDSAGRGYHGDGADIWTLI
jgi:hypothetical protein